MQESLTFKAVNIVTGPNWTVVSGLPEGQTVSGQLGSSQSAVWSHPLDIHYITKGLQGKFLSTQTLP